MAEPTVTSLKEENDFLSEELTRLRAENERLGWRAKSLEGILRGTEVRAEQAERGRYEARLAYDHANKSNAGLQAQLTAVRAENERLEREMEDQSCELENAKNPVYCIKCGSCGHEGCCPAETCMYPGYAAQDYKDRLEDAEAQLTAVRAEGERMRRWIVRAERACADPRMPRQSVGEMLAAFLDQFPDSALTGASEKDPPPRPMTGFWDTLTPDQRRRVLEYDGPENIGRVPPPRKRKP